MNFEIYNGDELANTIHADEAFCADYCARHGYTYKLRPDPEPDPDPVPIPKPTQLDRVEAQVTYTAMMTDTLLEV